MRANSERGFTLLEAVVALAVLTLSLAMLYRGAATGLALTGDAADVQQAVARAKSHLAVLGYGTVLRAGDEGGNDGSGFHWASHVAELRSGVRESEDPDDPQTRTRDTIRLYDVRVTISWARDGKPHAVTLSTHRVQVSGAGPA